MAIDGDAAEGLNPARFQSRREGAAGLMLR
jgi:hypothetical protein